MADVVARGVRFHVQTMTDGTPGARSSCSCTAS